MNVKALKIDNSKTDYRFLKANNILPKDDGFHGNINLLDIEWWYFDAVFDNGYSIHLGIRTYHIRSIGIVQSRINIYKKGEGKIEAMKTNLLSDFYTSNDLPSIYIENKPIVEFDNNHYVKTGEWRYQISLKIDNHEVDLTFTGTTKGWKIETSKTCWTVALPKAKVAGNITINRKKIPVRGVGYHDHNWNYSPVTAMNNLGWFWGRTTGETLNITWAKTIQSDEKGDLLAIINQDKNNNHNQKEFLSIPPTSIKFKLKNLIKDHRKWIPSEFYLSISRSISDDDIQVDANIDMKTLYFQHTRIFTIHYWRYHVLTNGKISLGSITETLNEKPQIIEFLSFK